MLDPVTEPCPFTNAGTKISCCKPTLEPLLEAESSGTLLLARCFCRRPQGSAAGFSRTSNILFSYNHPCRHLPHPI